LLGLAAGDALGTKVEFEYPGTFAPVTTMAGGGCFRLAPGQWTDDTSMALCLAESLIETGAFDPLDQMRRYVRWFREGHWSSTGRCFDIGNTTRDALARFERSGDPWSGPTSRDTAGNGSLMRVAPVPLRYAGEPGEAIRLAGEHSRTTHGATTAVDACRYFGGLIVGALHGLNKSELLSSLFSPVPDLWEKSPLAPEIMEIASGSFRHKQPPEIRSTGYVVDTLEAALWAFHNSVTFEEGCLLAVNLGGDADTCGAVYGQIAGAYYGVEGIPEHWRSVITFREEIERMADQLSHLAT
jgi:ADP-ribosyl-[dinitrogen reductase] hydrolase